MGQQPNIEFTEADRPRPVSEPPAPGRWRPTKPGLMVAPDQVPRGGRFGTAGPDAGWALKLLARADLPDSDPRLPRLLEGLVMRRAAALGRAPIPEDIEVALLLCGYGLEGGPELVERRQRWLAAVPHESRPGSMAASEVDLDLIRKQPGQIRRVGLAAE